MRICLYTNTALPEIGGQELVVDSLARQFTLLGHDVKVLAPFPRRSRDPDDERLPYEVVRHPRLRSTRYWVPWYARYLSGLSKAFAPDVVNCHGIYPMGYLAALCRPSLRAPIVLTSHGDDVWAKDRRLAKPGLRERYVQALQAADALVAISRFTSDGYEMLCPTHKRVEPIPNGVDYAPLTRPVGRQAFADSGVQSHPYALFLGRLDRRKGVDVLLDALATLPATGGVELVIAGDGRERKPLESQVRRLNLGSRVQFVGCVQGQLKFCLLQNARCAVVPSRDWEAFGLVVLESFAAGCPVIASDLPGLADLIEPGRTGWLVPPESPAALARALRQAMSDPAAAKKLGAAGRVTAMRLGWRSIAGRYLALYEEVAWGTKRVAPRLLAAT